MMNYCLHKMRFMTDITPRLRNTWCQTRWETPMISWWCIQKEVNTKVYWVCIQENILSNKSIIDSNFQIVFTGNNSSLQYLPQDNDHLSTTMLGRSSGAMSSEPRKFTKYNPSSSRRSLQPIYRNNSTGQQNGERKRVYMAASEIGLNSFPSKYLYSRNFDIPHAEVRPTIAHGM